MINPTSRPSGAQVKWGRASVAEGVLLTAMRELFAKHPDLLAFVFDPAKPCLRRAPRSLIEEARRLSHGEALLVRVALDLWNQSSGVGLYELIERLDAENFGHVIIALRMLGPKPPSKDPLRRPPGRKADSGWDGTLF